MIWFKDYRLDDLKSFRNTNMTAHLGFEFTEVGPDFLKGRLPVDNRTTQPFGILHGGASCVLAESLGSVASWMTIDPDKYRAVGIEINANHIRAVTKGHVIGTCTPLHVVHLPGVHGCAFEETAEVDVSARGGRDAAAVERIVHRVMETQ